MASKGGKKEKRTRENRSVLEASGLYAGLFVEEGSAGLCRILRRSAGFCGGCTRFSEVLLCSDTMLVTMGNCWRQNASCRDCH